ncbi:hypothetical protein [Oenococcus sicerae]|uniref:hypothetical protein n=1 Tax=Oenococcus sicerae TaxID=2203724 RepID=UPI0039EA2567
MILQLTLFENGLPVNSFLCSDYAISADYLSNDTSTFQVSQSQNVQAGDFLLAKAQGDSRVLFYGQIESVDHDSTADVDTVTARFIYNLLNGDIIVTNKTGTSYEAHLVNLINNYVSSMARNSPFYEIQAQSNTAFAVSTTDNIKTYNLVDYLIRGFKLHNVVMSVRDVIADENYVPAHYRPEIQLKQITDKLTLKDTAAALTNWSIQNSELTRGYANELWIVDQASTDMENPTVLDRYWLQTDGTIVHAINSNVIQPTKVVISLFDKTATDNLSYAQIATNTLTGNAYSHLIQFDVLRDNNVIDVDQLVIGTLTTIIYHGQTYNSVLSGYLFSSDSDYVTLMFGNIRNTLKDVMNSDN